MPDSSVESPFSQTNPEDWIRGSTLENIEQRCLDLCAEYIGGSWTNATNATKDIEVKRIAGGLTNQLYYVGLKDHVKRVANEVYPNEPHEITIKFYQPKHLNNMPGKNERLSDTIIALVGSQLKVAPTVYGLFDDGVIQAYYKHESFKAKYQADDRLSRKLMHNLAAINLYQIPLPKTRIHQHLELKRCIEGAYKFFNIPELSHKYELETLNKCDMLHEFLEFEKILSKLKMPLGFCHNDFRFTNVLVTGEKENEKDLVIVDLEYCCYGYRAHDIATMVLDWGRDDYRTSRNLWPSDEVIRRYATFYLEGCDLVQLGYSIKPGNSLDDLVREIRICIAENLMYLMVLVINLREAIIPNFDLKTQLTMTNQMFKSFLDAKQQLIDDGIIPK